VEFLFFQRLPLTSSCASGWKRYSAECPDLFASDLQVLDSQLVLFVLLWTASSTIVTAACVEIHSKLLHSGSGPVLAGHRLGSDSAVDSG
jgi:hypothetical protein